MMRLISPLDVRAMKDALAVAASIHELAVHEAGPAMTTEHLVAMRPANERLALALRTTDADGAARAPRLNWLMLQWDPAWD